jgi:hypothetical protein
LMKLFAGLRTVEGSHQWTIFDRSSYSGFKA